MASIKAEQSGSPHRGQARNEDLRAQVGLSSQESLLARAPQIREEQEARAAKVGGQDQGAVIGARKTLVSSGGGAQSRNPFDR